MNDRQKKVNKFLEETENALDAKVLYFGLSFFYA